MHQSAIVISSADGIDVYDQAAQSSFMLREQSFSAKNISLVARQLFSCSKDAKKKMGLAGHKIANA